ncbi:hypothetical protein [Deinococcus ficus]|uniref:hypothetical protein n=1 Tax=Deinococcus ficus TaxID=317577 RepID=UPI0003B6D569|nr:hypothetical protein [Deinococcus ficus]
MPLPLASLLALGHGDHAHLDALVSEGAVRQAFVDAGHHVAGFGFWAVRRRARRQDPMERLLRQPRDGTWLVLSPAPPGELEAGDAALLARVIQGLHGVQFVQWTAWNDRLSFTSWSLRTTVVRGAPLLMPGPARPEGTLALPPGPLLPDLTRWTGVPDAQLGAALIESAYVERVAGADQGAFTNVDVLALAGDRPGVVEVKRRARTEEQSGHPLTMTVTQSGTLGHLRAAGCEVHVAVLVALKGSTRHPADALARGTWRAGAAVIRPGWGEMHVDLLGAVPGPSLEALRRAQEDAALGLAPPGPVPDRVRPRPQDRPVKGTAPKPTPTPLRPATRKLKAARR